VRPVPERLRCCVCTSYRADAEPRGPRHAAALADISPEFEIVFIDCVPAGAKTQTIRALAGKENIVCLTNYYPQRSSGLFRLIVRRVRQIIAQGRFRLTGNTSPLALSTRVAGLERLLRSTKADVFLAHNIDTLLPTFRAARALGATLMFDSMEFHSEMGDSQSRLEQSLVRKIEAKCLPECALVLAASDQIADELAKVYGIARPVALYNAPALTTALPSPKSNAFQLYWRNSVLGLGQRGLDDALQALQELPDDITLHLQGRLGHDGGIVLKKRINELGLNARIVFHPPYAPDDAVIAASSHTIGLCLERSGVKNHDLTVSNKIFDYHMAGLVTIASDLPGLRAVLEKSNGGLTFQPGSAKHLVRAILTLHGDRDLLKRLSANARAFALSVGNSQAQMAKFKDAFLRMRATRPRRTDG
jgi:glycosyltransferase involved in cell wall biosynthesis